MDLNGKPHNHESHSSSVVTNGAGDERHECERPSKRRVSGRDKVAGPAQFVKLSLNKFYDNAESIDDIMRKDAVDKPAADVIRCPFKCFVLPDIIDEEASQEKYLSSLSDELLTLDYDQRDNDLNQFQQSVDFKSVESDHKHIQALRNLFLTRVRPLIERLLNSVSEERSQKIRLSETQVNLAASRYQFTDYLLPHDDHLEGRRVAFILYLVDSAWSETDGGTLDLFDCDSNFIPGTVVRKIVPVRNTLVAFEVTPRSWHQVSEILSEKVRVSVGGWFLEGSKDRIEWPVPVPEAEPVLYSPLETVEEESVRQWINEQCLKEEIALSIGEQFRETSEIRMDDFIRPMNLSRLMEALQSTDLKWTNTGTPNMRNYLTLSTAEELPSPIKELVEVMQSDAMFLVLSNMTGLRLHPMVPESDDEQDALDSETEDKKECDPKCRFELRKWTTGSYSLCHDLAHETREMKNALDVMLFLGEECANGTEFYRASGGYVAYTAAKDAEASEESESTESDSDDDPNEPLLTIEPQHNTLNIVYREEGTLRFMKYLNHREGQRTFYELSFVYYE